MPAPRTSKNGPGRNRNAASKRAARAKAVGAFLPKITSKAFERFGFPAAAILTDWTAIAGPELAAYTRPERIKWRKSPNQTEPLWADDQTDAGQDCGATLLLRVDGARAIELQHKAPQVLERINAYFGYRAITELRMLQAPIVAKSFAAGVPAHPGRGGPRKIVAKRRSASAEVAGDASVQRALNRLAAGIAKQSATR